MDAVSRTSTRAQAPLPPRERLATAMKRPARETAPPTWIRGAVREVLERTSGYQTLAEADRRSLAHAMVRVSALAAELIDEEEDASTAIESPAAAAPLARAQSQPDFAEFACRQPCGFVPTLGVVAYQALVGVYESLSELRRDSRQRLLKR